MRSETIKQKKLSTWLLALMLFILPSSLAYADCYGTVYFQAPASWSNVVYVVFNNATVAVPATVKDAQGYFVVNMSLYTATGNTVTTYNFANSSQMDYPLPAVVNGTGYDTSMSSRIGTLTCPGASAKLYVTEDPLNPGTTYEGTNPPSAKYFYFLLPDQSSWMSAVPMISTDNGVTGTPMEIDPDACGWYRMIYAADQVPDGVVVYRDDDAKREDVIGWNGYNETELTATPIPLSQYTAEFDKIWYIPDEDAWPNLADPLNKGFFTADPGQDGNCTYSLAALIYDTDASLHPSFSCDVYAKGTDYNAAGDCQVGVASNPAGAIDKTSAQSYVSYCRGVMPGIVQDTLGLDNKPRLNTTAGANGLKCFPSEAYFNQLFNVTPGVNEQTCYNLPFSRATDGKWEFNSDYYTSAGAAAQGGFYPVENTVNTDILNGGTPVVAARTKRTAEGPVYVVPYLRSVENTTENATRMDLFCNGPGWTGGHDCATLFKNGDDLTALLPQTLTGSTYDVWCWGDYCNSDKPDEWPSFVKGTERDTTYASGASYSDVRWTSDPATAGQLGRNQQFCFESHAQFKYKDGLRFSFRGDDDIWVFIGGKLAVDLGGTHLAAPGYVDLSSITDKNGAALVSGQPYNIDIFFCDRRTTMSNVRIKTNMYIEQSTGLDYQKVTGDETAYELCWEETGEGDCAAAMGGASSGTQRYCGDTLCALGKTVSYQITKRNGEVVYDTAALSQAIVYFGGIDLTNRCTPHVDKTNLYGLPSGTYKLVMIVDGKSTSITFRIAGTLDVVNANARSDSLNKVWTFKNYALAGTRIPVYVTALGEAINGYLDVDVASAVNEGYGVTFSTGLEVYLDSVGGTPITNLTPLTVGASGVDTLWATVSMESMTAATVSHTIQVTGRGNIATLTFTLPQIAFVDSNYKVKVSPTGINFFNEEELWVGSYYDLFLVAYDPTVQTAGGDTVVVCEACNFSTGITLPSTGLRFITTDFVNGRASVQVASAIPYPDTTTKLNASFTVIGAENALINATWNELEFSIPPVPAPQTAQLFDAHGVAKDYNGLDSKFKGTGVYLDGIGDSLRITYSRHFNRDSLPDSILVQWAVDTDTSVLLTKAEILAAATCSGKTSADSCDPTLVFSGIEFSGKIQTAGVGAIVSWATFAKKNAQLAEPHDLSTILVDKIAPIITRAHISEVGDGGDLFQVQLAFSEPIAPLPDSLKSLYGEILFHYYLRSATELSSASARYIAVPSRQSSWADSVVTLIYSKSDGSIPMSGDFVRMRADLHLLSDTLGNYPTNWDGVSVATPWASLEGDAGSSVTSIRMASLDPTDPEIKKRENDKEQVSYYFVDLYASKDDVRKDHPSTLGYIIQTDMGNILSDPQYDSLINMNLLSLSDIRLVYETYYFTNLGGYVASGKGEIACNDSIFGGDCRSQRGYVYIAWNLMSESKRFVGSGPYIAKLSTYVDIKGFGKRAKHEVSEIWGVMRGKGIIK